MTLRLRNCLPDYKHIQRKPTLLYYHYHTKHYTCLTNDFEAAIGRRLWQVIIRRCSKQRSTYRLSAHQRQVLYSDYVTCLTGESSWRHSTWSHKVSMITIDNKRVIESRLHRHWPFSSGAWRLICLDNHSADNWPCYLSLKLCLRQDKYCR